MVSPEKVKSVTLLRLQGAEVRGRIELMQASFDGTFPAFPLPNPESGLFRIHVVTFHLFNFWLFAIGSGDMFR